MVPKANEPLRLNYLIKGHTYPLVLTDILMSNNLTQAKRGAVSCMHKYMTCPTENVIYILRQGPYETEG